MPTATELLNMQSQSRHRKSWQPESPTFYDEVREYLKSAEKSKIQTYLPYPDFRRSAEALSDRHLSIQRIEAHLVLRTLCGYQGGWTDHPCVAMWRGHLDLLSSYYNKVVQEWILRGFRHQPAYATLFIPTPVQYNREYNYLDTRTWPPWLGNPDLHSAHRAALLASEPDTYNTRGWIEEPKIEYYWPIGG